MEIYIRFQTTGLGYPDQQVQMGAPLHQYTEEPVLASNDKRPDCVFSQVVVDVQSSNVQITDQLVPLVVKVAHGPAGLAARRPI